MRGVNDEEVSDFIHLIQDVAIDVRFIELMPFEDNNWDKGKLITYYEILQKLEDKVMFIMNCLYYLIINMSFQKKKKRVYI